VRLLVIGVSPDCPKQAPMGDDPAGVGCEDPQDLELAWCEMHRPPTVVVAVPYRREETEGPPELEPG
jgi:hypothetical protein